MKRFFFFLLVFVITLVYSNTKVEAACTAPYTSYTKTITYGTCTFDVEYCYWYSPSGFHYVELKQIIFDVSDCSGGINLKDSGLWDIIETQLLLDINSRNVLTPCPNANLNFQLELAGCWQTFNDIEHQMSRIIPCEGSGWCRKSFKVCYNYSTGLIEKTLVGTNTNYTSNCASPEVVNPFTYGDGCFILCY